MTMQSQRRRISLVALVCLQAIHYVLNQTEVPFVKRLPEVFLEPDGPPSRDCFFPPSRLPTFFKSPHCSANQRIQQLNSRGKSSAIGGAENKDIHPVELGDNNDQLRRRPIGSEDADNRLACPQGERTRRQVSAAVSGKAGALWISDNRPMQGEGTSQQNGAGTNAAAHATQLPETGLAQTEERRQKIDGGLESNGKTGTMGKRENSR
ncbi:hypothetical protein H4Q26_002190 [Puccinia striiformis f. sp. tritici PST-130]|nr:hypothetical protein H4Q26_002190 [Puccinia striiformis f. sp. tritici PST-130]